jgi:hypothetical protein
MMRWTIRPSYVFVLVSLLFLITLILVLPQVDLPDTAFDRGTAPVDVHVRSISAPVLVSVSPVVSLHFSTHSIFGRHEHFARSAHATSGSLPLLHRSLRC